MSYTSWRNKVYDYWESGSLPSSSESSITRSSTFPFNVSNNFPLDYRVLRDNVLQLFKYNTQYPGLKVYTVQKGQEYIFISDSVDSVQEYHPELAHFKFYDSATLPNNLATSNALGDGAIEITKNNSTVTYHTIPTGTEGTIQLNDGSFYKFVWNGSSWVQFANQGSGGSSTTIVRVVSDSVLSFASSDVTSINELTSEQISARYKIAHDLDTAAIISSGIEADVIFTDSLGFESSRKYVYLNGEWRIVQGVQEYLITIPAYDSSATWTENEVVAVSASSDIAVKRADVSGLVNVFISHQFNSQYVDAFVFEKNGTSENIDGGATPETPFLLTDLTS
ncbi:MAG: hypothetical protein IKE69_04325 [Thermoguttaceae bacterium]|nr:hypothetical protein [Thermoguttaceae bacterium]